MANARLGWFSPLGVAASSRRWPAPLRRCRSAGWPSGSLLPLFGTHRFGDCPRRVGLRVHRFRFSARTASEIAARRVGLRAHRFRFSACTASEMAAGRVGLRAHCFRFSACTDSEWPLGEFVLPPSASEIALGGLVFPLGELAFGLTASAFRHAPIRRLPSAGWFFRSASWPSGSWLPLFGLRRFGVAAGRVGSSAFRFGNCRWAGWPSGSRLPLFGTHQSAPPHRRREDRRSTPTRQLFHFKTLIPTC